LPRLIILDLGLSDMDGQQLLVHLREVFAGPIIILSVRHREAEKVQALDAGANDFVIKPFGIQELLLARVRNLLRQQGDVQVVPEVFDDGHLRVLMARLRTRLADDPASPRYLETEPGVGYRFLG
jgi:two-component system KDP operon response regulator KdpE